MNRNIIKIIMKKIFLLSAMVITTLSLKAQKGYVDANFGYGFGAPGSVLGQDVKINRFMFMETSREVSNISGSLGKGFNAQVTGGYMFNKHIGLEMGVNFFLGSNTMTNKMSIAQKDTTWNIDADNFSSSKSFARINQLRLIPAVVFSTDTVKGISGYAKLGTIIAVVGSAKTTTSSINSQIDYSNNGNIVRNRVDEEYLIKGQVSVGFRGAIGLNYNITSKIAVFGEAYVSSISVKHSSRTMKKYTVNGEDKLETIPVSQKEIEFVNKIDAQSNNQTSNQQTFDLNAPRHELYQKTNLTQIGIQIGFKYYF